MSLAKADDLGFVHDVEDILKHLVIIQLMIHRPLSVSQLDGDSGICGVVVWQKLAKDRVEEAKPLTIVQLH